MEKRHVGWALGGTLLVGLVVRSVTLNKYALWTDEVYTLHLAKQDFWTVVTHADQTPPLFALFQHFWIRLWGESDLAVRLPTLMFGILAIPVLFLLARRFATPAASLLASLLGALHLYLIIFSQDARAYSLMTLLGGLSMLQLLRLEEKWSGARAAAYVVSTVALLYSHSYAVFVVLAQNVYVLVAGRPKPFLSPSWIGLQAILGLAYLPWLPTIVGGTRHISQGFWILPPGWDDFYATKYDVSGGALTGYLYPLLALASLWAAWRFLRPRPNPAPRPKEPLIEPRPADPARPRRAVLLWGWLLIPTGLPFLISFWLPIYTPRYAVPSALPLLVLAVMGLERLRRPWPKRTAVALVAVCGLQLAGFYMLDQIEDPKQDWIGAVRVVEGTAQPNALVIFNQGLCDSTTDNDTSCAFERYSSRSDLRHLSVFPEDRGSFERLTEENIDRIDPELHGRPEVWVVYSFDNDAERIIVRHLEDLGWTQSSSVSLKHVDVLQFRQASK